MNKIIICGLNGSGKTTLGRELSKCTGFVHKDIEEYYFNNNDNYKYSSSNSKEEVTKKIEEDFNKYDNIILTACRGDYGNLGDKYTFAVFIHLDRETRIERVKQRSYQKFGDRMLEGGDLFQKENDFFNMVYQKDDADILRWFQNLSCNKIELEGTKTIEDNVEIIRNLM